MLAKKLLTTSGQEKKLDASDVFSTYLYTGNGSTQTINNGIDLAGEGGMVWCKRRDSTGSHSVWDTVRGDMKYLFTNQTMAEASAGPLISFGSSGFTLNSDAWNDSTGTFASWTFRKAPKFFDIVTWTGNGIYPRNIAHNLGQVPGMIIVKATNEVRSWFIYHRSLANNQSLSFDTGIAENGTAIWGSTTPTSTHFTVGNSNSNGSSVTYVAYLFAHDPEPEGLIQCGSFNSSAGYDATVEIGWEPQYVLVKATNTPDDWWIIDTMRGYANSTAPIDKILRPNATTAESSLDLGHPTSTGFYLYNLQPSKSFIYMAIRRPNKPPESGDEVYNAISRNGTGSVVSIDSVGFSPDMAFVKARGGAVEPYNGARLIGDKYLLTSETWAERTNVSEIIAWGNMGVTYGTSSNDAVTNASNSALWPYINHFFKRASGFFDVVCYKGNSTFGTAIYHSLMAIPELIIIKRRNLATGWMVKAPSVSTDEGELQSANGFNTFNSIGNSHTDLVFYTGTANSDRVNDSGGNYVAYLFATLEGISKVGSYTGNGSSQTINCGFSTGARFILIKRTDSTGDWYVWDSARGIVAANDPHLSLNTTAAEVTTNDSVDPASVGFIVNQNAATNINVNSGTYIFLAIA